MTEVHSQQDLSSHGPAATVPGIRARRGLRITLLSLAAAILLAGAAAAGVFAYRSLSHGSADGAAAAAAAAAAAR